MASAFSSDVAIPVDPFSLMYQTILCPMITPPIPWAEPRHEYRPKTSDPLLKCHNFDVACADRFDLLQDTHT